MLIPSRRIKVRTRYALSRLLPRLERRLEPGGPLMGTLSRAGGRLQRATYALFRHVVPVAEATFTEHEAGTEIELHFRPTSAMEAWWTLWLTITGAGALALPLSSWLGRDLGPLAWTPGILLVAGLLAGHAAFGYEVQKVRRLIASAAI